MEEKIEVTKTNRVKTKVKAQGKRGAYPFEMRLKAVQLRIKEGISVAVVCRELGIGDKTLKDWVQRYRLGGSGGQAAD